MKSKVGEGGQLFGDFRSKNGRPADAERSMNEEKRQVLDKWNVAKAEGFEVFTL